MLNALFSNKKMFLFSKKTNKKLVKKANVLMLIKTNFMQHKQIKFLLIRLGIPYPCPYKKNLQWKNKYSRD